MLITLIISAVILTIVSSLSKAIMDLSEDKKLKFKNEFFWLKAYSWKNKWKLDDKSNPIRVNGKYVEKFFGSSRWFVAQTDAWHLFGALMFYSYWISFTLSGFIIGYNFDNKYYLLLLKIPFLSRGIFHIFYTYKIFKK